MSSILPRSVRFAFVTLLLGLTVYTVAESVVGGRDVVAQAPAAEGLSGCGSEGEPCALPAVSVVAEPAPADAHLASTGGMAPCGTEAEPCVLAPVTVEAKRESARLASADRAPRMTIRAGS